MLALIGWPGAGRHRLARWLEAEVDTEVEVFSGLQWCQADERRQVWAVVDARDAIANEAELSELLNAAQVVVLMFWQQVDLSRQSRWLKQLKRLAPERPYALVMQDRLSAAQYDQLRAASLHAPLPLQPNWPVLQTWQFEVPKLSLQHLLFVLDTAKQNLGLKLWRAQGEFYTLEYDNRVALEGTRERWDQYVADDVRAQDWLRLQVEQGDRDEVAAWLQACYAPGH